MAARQRMNSRAFPSRFDPLPKDDDLLHRIRIIGDATFLYSSKLQLPGNDRQRYVRWVAAVVENGLRCRLPAAARGLVLPGVQIAVEPREVAGRNLQAHTMARQEHVARGPQVDRQLVDLV